MLSAEEEAREGPHQIIQSVSPQHDVDGDECLLITEMREEKGGLIGTQKEMTGAEKRLQWPQKQRSNRQATKCCFSLRGVLHS